MQPAENGWGWAEPSTSNGRKVSEPIASAKWTTYVYDAFGDLTATTDPGGNVTSATYDLRGRKTAASDPDMGSWSYGYDVLSELTSQSDAKGQSTTLSYDLLGRPMRRNEADLDSLWKYDTATNGVGKLTDACAASTCSTANYERSYVYDTLGRETRQALTIAGTTYHYDITYNSDGRVATLSYPSGFVAQYDYTSLGYLADIKDHSTGAAIWTANSADAELHLTQATAGNNVVTDNSFDANTGRLLNICATTSSGSCTGNVANLSYDWDSIGNLTDRADTYEGYTEEFCYDNLNRLVNYAIASTCTSSGDKTVAYDSLGDISSKSDVGTYTYPASGSGSVRPHAVSSIAGTVNGVVDPTFTYDANGNMTAGDGRTVTYTSFNMAASVSEGTTTLGFLYDSEHRRYEQCLGGCTSPTSTTTYLYGPATSEKVVSGTNVTWNDYITASGGIVAERINNAGTVSLLYFTGDHLGSTSVLTNASGAVVERDSYDAFGKRRNANGTDNTACSITSSTTRGYTAQEMMDSVCLTNMNARLYDQTIGRFQSADTMVPDATNGQAFNRYSYVGNNPLAFTDPTGHASESEHECFTCIVRIGGADASTVSNGDGMGDGLGADGSDGGSSSEFSDGADDIAGSGDLDSVDGAPSYIPSDQTPELQDGVLQGFTDPDDPSANEFAGSPNTGGGWYGDVFAGISTLLGVYPAENGGEGRDSKNNKTCSLPKAAIYGGLTGHYQTSLGNGAGTVSSGLVLDTTGQVAWYVTGGPGVGIAPTRGLFGGIEFGGFNGLNSDMGGPFAAFNASASDGEGFGAEGFAGSTADGRPIIGAGGALGVGEGVTTFAGVTETYVGPSVPIQPLISGISPMAGSLLNSLTSLESVVCRSL
jgi:RHS repeat-associated protein